MPTRLGLTGGIGSGKSTVAQLFAQLGATLIDADAVSRQLTASGGAAITEIANSFGADYIDADGALDRARMRQLVFARPESRQRLEAILHPLIQQECARLSQRATDEGRRCLVFDIPLLVESGHWRGRLDRILVVDCDPDTQIQRTMARSALSPAAVEAIMRTQTSRAHRLSAADAVVYNGGQTEMDSLAHEVSALATLFGL